MVSNHIPNFVASQCGLQFTNSWPSEPDITIKVPVYGDVTIGDASNGLCGGMAFTVRDLYEMHLPPLPYTTNPLQGSPLYDYIVQRLFDSFNIPSGVAKYFGWMNTPDHDTGVPPLVRHGVAWYTVMNEWPQIKADIDAGHPSPLGLVTVFSTNPVDLGQNHQVLAYGYDLDASNNLTLHLYDPNTSASAADNVTLSLNLSNPAHSTEITHNLEIDHPIRGFFRIDYTFRDPSFLQPTPLVSVSPAPPLPEGQAITLAVQAIDATSLTSVTGAVTIDGVSVAQTNVPFTYTFTPKVIHQTKKVYIGRGPNGKPEYDFVTITTTMYPKGQVTAPGYTPVPIDFGFHDHSEETPSDL